MRATRAATLTAVLIASSVLAGCGESGEQKAAVAVRKAQAAERHAQKVAAVALNRAERATIATETPAEMLRGCHRVQSQLRGPGRPSAAVVTLEHNWVNACRGIGITLTVPSG